MRKHRINRPRPEPQRALVIPWRKISLATAAVLVLMGTFAGLGALLNRPVTFVIAGVGQRVSGMEVQAALAGYEGQGFLAADLDAIRAAAEALPWVDRVRVQRAFPARLRVTVTEQVAAARWGNDGLLNTRGELFVENSRFALPELPALAGPEGSEWRIAQRYLEAYSQLTPQGFIVRSLSMNARGAWDLEFASGLRVHLGRDQSGGRLRRFAVTVAPLIQDRITAIDYVDMRYGNGFAVRWKSGQLPVGSRDTLQG